MIQKTMHKMTYWLLYGLVIVAGTACSGSDDDVTVKPEDEVTTTPDDGVKVRRLTITETDGSSADARPVLTRASLVEDDGLSASWTAGDRLTYCNLMRTQYNGQTDADEPVFGSLTAASTAATSQFMGDVTCRQGDYLAVVYPATTFTTNSGYTITLSGQDGTLGKLATSYHYVYGKAYVTAVTETMANATMERMKSLLTVCKFSFVDKTTGDAIPVKTLEISYGGSGSDAGKYPQTATVAIKDGSTIKEQVNVHATEIAGSTPLTITCATAQEAVYVALLPTVAARTFNFTVTNAGGTYTGSANAWLKEGEYVAATGLKLTE